MQLYPYLTDRILRRGSLAQLADIASASQERLDGSGYPRGLSGATIPWQRGCWPQPTCTRRCASRDPIDPRSRPRTPPSSCAAKSERAESTRTRQRPSWPRPATGRSASRSAPADLTEREVEVLRLIARGRTSAETASELGIQTKTVGSHIEHIYAKIGASNRSVATLFAMQHGLV